MSGTSINTLHKFVFNRIDSNLRWVHLVTPPWIGDEGATIEAYVVFSDATRRLEDLVLVSPSGQQLTKLVEPVSVLPDALAKFNDLPEKFKDFFKVSFTLDRPEIVVGQATVANETVSLFTLVPTIIYPGFLSDILKHGTASYDGVTFNNFVETGTLFAHTAIHASHLFERVYSIELDKQLHAKASRLTTQFPNIRFINGDSGVEVGNVIDQLNGATVFFLDAHWSGDETVDWSSSKFSGFPSNTSHLGEVGSSAPTSSEQVPLDKELDEIFGKFAHEALIIIDDWQSIGRKDYAFVGEDWSHLSHGSLLEQFNESRRVKFHYPFDDKHYVVGLNAR